MEEKNYFDFFSDENKTKEESIDLSFDDNSFEKTQNINLNSYGQIKKNHKTKIKANDIRLLNQLRKSTINEVINELPKDKEYFHIVSNGSFDYFGIVKRIIELNSNDNFIFYGSTWTMNYDNTDDLINLINLGKIIDCTMITGEYLQQR